MVTADIVAINATVTASILCGSNNWLFSFGDTPTVRPEGLTEHLAVSRSATTPSLVTLGPQRIEVVGDGVESLAIEEQSRLALVDSADDSSLDIGVSE